MRSGMIAERVMAGIVRAGVMIGAIALFSPVHEQPVEQRLASIKAAPGALAAEALQQAPGMAAQAGGALDEDSRRKLAALAAEAALSSLRRP
jgi:hypothetical protein